ncbi:hypothetical protein COU80_04095 [Candidatus Peregrinibacteria bacterium CG10_big_fil_rev_8_21_14_0_10_55_24]|nr:MAG: hypothetical protein COU80_04095 [Candidatus Peregrinibacteria bacterium CG10_big_fil_rev_8_21_14_0_10_55_24]
MPFLIVVLLGWALAIAILEYVMWRIFYAKTLRIAFLTEPDMPFSKYLTIGIVRVLVLIHATTLYGVVLFFTLLLW